jgi:hypothetical protein
MTAVTVWLRSGTMDVVQVTPADLEAFEGRLKMYQKKAGKKYNPGTHCGFCPGLYECKARAAMQRSATSAIALTSGSELTPAVLGRLWSQARVLKGALDDYREMVRATVLAGGVIEIAPGKVLAMKEVESLELDTLLGWEVLTKAGFQDKHMARVAKLSMAAVREVARSFAPRGQKSEAEDLLVQQLRAAGAVKAKITNKLEEKDNE